MFSLKQCTPVIKFWRMYIQHEAIFAKNTSYAIFRVFCALFVFISFGSIAYAHPPSDIIITFDAKTNILNAVIVPDAKVGDTLISRSSQNLFE